MAIRGIGFNTQPPEGGWNFQTLQCFWKFRFQHTAARRRLAYLDIHTPTLDEFQHTAARRRLVKRQANRKINRVFQHTAARRRLVRRILRGDGD